MVGVYIMMIVETGNKTKLVNRKPICSKSFDFHNFKDAAQEKWLLNEGTPAKSQCT